MSDLVMCANKDCPKAPWCERITGPKAKMQRVQFFKFKRDSEGRVFCANYYYNGKKGVK